MMTIKKSTVLASLLAVAISSGAAFAQSSNNSGNKTPDETDMHKRSGAPAAGQMAPVTAPTVGSGATNTNSGRLNPDEQDIKKGNAPAAGNTSSKPHPAH